MHKRFILLAVALGLCLSPAVMAANIIFVTETGDTDANGVQDDLGFEDFLKGLGHQVDVRRGNWTTLDAAKIAELNAADLVVVSRRTGSAQLRHRRDRDRPVERPDVAHAAVDLVPLARHHVELPLVLGQLRDGQQPGGLAGRGGRAQPRDLQRRHAGRAATSSTRWTAPPAAARPRSPARSTSAAASCWPRPSRAPTPGSSNGSPGLRTTRVRPPRPPASECCCAAAPRNPAPRPRARSTSPTAARRSWPTRSATCSGR